MIFLSTWHPFSLFLDLLDPHFDKTLDLIIYDKDAPY